MAKKPSKVALLSGGNPQIAGADGAAPVMAYIAAMPGWKRDVGRRLDRLICKTVPGVWQAAKLPGWVPRRTSTRSSGRARKPGLGSPSNGRPRPGRLISDEQTLLSLPTGPDLFGSTDSRNRAPARSPGSSGERFPGFRVRRR